MLDRRSAPRPWLFALTAIPYGVGGSFTGQLMPSFAEDAGYKLGSIGWFTMLLFVPTWLQFLYTPVIDLGWSRRYWLIALSLVGGACFGVACMIPLETHLYVFLAAAFVGQVITGLVASCNGALMATTIPDEQRGRAGALYNIGNISGGAVVAFGLIELHGNVPGWLLAIITVALTIAPAFAVLLIVEPPREARVAAPFQRMWADVSRVIFSRTGITGILLMLSPVGTAALTNSFTGINGDYGASKRVAGLLSGPIGAVLTAAGAWIGGLICDRQSRRAMYLLSAVLTAIVALAVARAPQSEWVYIVGVSAYNLVTGFCFAAFTATVLETIGHGDAAAGTKYTLFTAAGNVAIAYVNLIDTRAYDRWDNSTHALFTCDALLNIGGALALGLVFWRLASFGATKHPPEQVVDTDPPPEPAQLPTARIHDK